MYFNFIIYFYLIFQKGIITIRIQVPNDDEKPEWKLNGQILNIQVDLKDNISNIKEKIKDQLGMPPNKQKLKSPGLPILLDKQSLASYNIMDSTTLELGIKSRGGRK
jgi:splicing factor 3A subunit 1